MLVSTPNHNTNNNNNNNNNINTSGEAQESGGTSGGSCGDAGGTAVVEHGGAGNRWPRQETLALLKIRSEMELAFRDSSLKGPLWEEISRKMAELGYHRNGKKCKEKFENVYKYHKRTKEGRSSKADGKTYRFFDQLSALETIGGAPPLQLPPPLPSSVQLTPTSRPSPPQPMVTMAVPIQVVQATPSPSQNILSPHQHQITVSSTPQNTNVNFNNPFTSPFPQSSHPPPPHPPGVAMPPNFFSNSPSSSSSTSSDEEIERRGNRKRKYKEFFESLMQTVVQKQEDLQRKFLETLEKRERDRMIREEAWRVQEMARLKIEHDLLVQERSIAAERESALISILQKMTQNQQNPNNPEKLLPQIPTPLPPGVVKQSPQPPPALVKQSTPPPPPPVVKQSTPPPQLHMVEPPLATPPIAPQPIRMVENTPPRHESNNGGGMEIFNTSSATSSRWPKAEIDALINLRTYLDNKYQENGPKGPLWEEISSEMKKLGYNRNAKRCKEKWENINKYYKKVKESNKKRPEDSKTCPYFSQLDALYKEKEKSGKPENPMLPIIARPEQQWPFAQQHQQHQPQPQPQAQAQQVPQLQLEQQLQQQQQHQEHAMEEQEGENNDEDYDDEEDEGEDDEEDEGSAYEIVTNKQPSSVTSTA